MKRAKTILCLLWMLGVLLVSNLSHAADKDKSSGKSPVKIGAPSKAAPAKAGSPAVSPEALKVPVAPIKMEVREEGGRVFLILSRAARVEIMHKGNRLTPCPEVTKCDLTEVFRNAGNDDLTIVVPDKNENTPSKRVSTGKFAHLFKKPSEKKFDPSAAAPPGGFKMPSAPGPSAPAPEKAQPAMIPQKAVPPTASIAKPESADAAGVSIESIFARGDAVWVKVVKTGPGRLGSVGALTLDTDNGRKILVLSPKVLEELSRKGSSEVDTGIELKERSTVRASIAGDMKSPSKKALITPMAALKPKPPEVPKLAQKAPKSLKSMSEPAAKVPPTFKSIKKTPAALTPPSESMMQARSAVPLAVGPLAQVIPGSAYGLRVTLEGGGSVFHPGDEIIVHFEIENPDTEGFYPMSSDWWRYHEILYLHDRSHDIDAMGLWRVPRHSLITLSDDRRRGSFRVTVPAGLPESGAYVISIVWSGDAYGHSGLFSVWPSGIAGRDVIVDEPNTRVRWAQGSLRTIRWRFFENPSGTGESDFRFIPRDRFIVEVLRSGSVVDTVPLDGLDCEAGSNRCSIGWIVPDTLPAGSGYRIRVRHSDVVSLSGEPPGDESNSDFEITAGARIRIDNPPEGRRVDLFGPPQITGYISGIERGSFNIRLLQYGSLVKVLREGYTPASPMFDVSQLLATSCDDPAFDNVLRMGSGSQYQIEFEYIDNPEIRGVSGNFYIVKPTIDVLAPDGGETWRNGETHQIRWEFGRLDVRYLGTAASTLDILLERGGFMGTEVECIARNLPAQYTGSYSWTVGAGCDSRGTTEGADLGSAPSATGFMGGVPDRVPPGTTFRVRVRSSLCPRIQGLSSADFAITD